jgi:hypothetical protein
VLSKFKVKNYKNFKEETVFDFSKHKDYQYNKHLIYNDHINTALIYGKNSSGKSNFGLALFDITLHLVDRENNPFQHSYYLNANSDESYAFFSYKFIFDGDIVLYEYKKNNSKTLVYEKLYVNNKKVFSYNFITQKGDFQDLKLIDAHLLNFKFTDEKMNISMLRYMANNANISKDSLLKKLIDFVSHMLWFRSLKQNSYIGYLKGGESIIDNIISNNMVKSFNKFLNDIGIDEKLSVKQDISGQKVLVSVFNNQSLPFWNIASSGTQAITLYYYWSQKFSDISFLFVDEFDAFYHYELAEYVIKQISEKQSFQSIFTTHNTSLMTNKFLRPDCLYIISNNKLHALPDCTERELREGHNLEKMYKDNIFNG